VIALSRVEKHILVRGGCFEVVRTAIYHYSGVVIDEGLGNAMGTEQLDNHQDISVSPCVVVPKEVHCVHDAVFLWRRHARKAYALLVLSWCLILKYV
jgi:hypothetical protein